MFFLEISLEPRNGQDDFEEDLPLYAFEYRVLFYYFLLKFCFSCS